MEFAQIEKKVAGVTNTPSQKETINQKREHLQTVVNQGTKDEFSLDDSVMGQLFSGDYLSVVETRERKRFNRDGTVASVTQYDGQSLLFRKTQEAFAKTFAFDGEKNVEVLKDDVVEFNGAFWQQSHQSQSTHNSILKVAGIK